MSTELSVLMIDDNPADGDMVQRYLDEGSFPGEVHFTQTLSAEEALSVLEDQEFDVLIVDYHFPFGNGFDILRKLREDGTTAPAVMLTGQGDENIAGQAVKENLNDYVPKAKLDPETLQESIETALSSDIAKSSDYKDSAFPSGSGEESRLKGPGILLKQLSKELNEPTPGGLLLFKLEFERDDFHPALSLTKLSRIIQTNTAACIPDQFFRAGVRYIAGILDHDQFQDLSDRDDANVLSELQGEFDESNVETADSGPNPKFLLLMVNLKSRDVDPVRPVNRGLDYLSEREPDNPKKKILRLSGEELTIG